MNKCSTPDATPLSPAFITLPRADWEQTLGGIARLGSEIETMRVELAALRAQSAAIRRELGTRHEMMSRLGSAILTPDTDAADPHDHPADATQQALLGIYLDTLNIPRKQAERTLTFLERVRLLCDAYAALVEAPASVEEAPTVTTPIEQVIQAVVRERAAYQDVKWGNLDAHDHTIMEWTWLMKDQLAGAKLACTMGDGRLARLKLLQAITVGVAALEQHGVVERPTQEAPNVE